MTPGGRGRTARRAAAAGRALVVSGALLLPIAGCAAAVAVPEPPAAADPAAPPAADATGAVTGRADVSAADALAADVPPAGHGTLRQDDATVALQVGSLLVKIVPLDAYVTRVLAPDTDRRLGALAEARRAEAARVTSTPALFLVSFFSHEQDAAFQAESLQLSHRGRLLRPAAVLPVSAGFGSGRLRQQEPQFAVYVFDGAIDYDQPITVRYGAQQSDAWSSIIPRLEVERARVRARAGGR
jgi:hypothetical protein